MINTAQLQSHTTEVDACAITVENAQDTTAGIQNQVSQNALGLILTPYAIVTYFDVRNLPVMMKGIPEAGYRLAACLRQTVAKMAMVEDRRVKGTKEVLGDLQEPITDTGAGPGGGDDGGGDPGDGNGVISDGGRATGGTVFPTPSGGDDSLDDDKDKDREKEDDFTSLPNGNDKISVTNDKLRAFLKKQCKGEDDDLKTFCERQKENQAGALERYAKVHPGEDIPEVKSLIERNQQKQQDAMTDFLARQCTDEEAQVHEWVKDNPTAASREFDTFVSKQRTDQQTSYRTFVEEQQKVQNTRIEEFARAHPDSKSDDVKSLLGRQDQHGDQDINTFLNRQRQDEEHSPRRFIFEGVKKWL